MVSNATNPWETEPDKEHFITRAKLPAVLNRSSVTGAWCGYVGISPRHPLHGLHYGETRVPRERLPVDFATREFDDHLCVLSAIAEIGRDDGLVSLTLAIRVHGGLTYSDSEPGGGLPDRWRAGYGQRWWFGFDCGHSMDLCPNMPQYLGIPGQTYKTIEYARAECESLAEQLTKWPEEK